MATDTDTSPIIILSGPPQASGVYLLWITLAGAQSLAFGRYRRGEPVSLPAGGYVYVGSAHGKRGASSLGYRLLRHATRSEGSPHHMRPLLLKRLQEKGLPAKLPNQKSLHWHIDYLLESPDATLEGIAAIMTGQRMEARIAAALAQMPETRVVAAGLGASDHAGGTHLLHVPAGRAWWAGLTRQIRDDGNLFL